VLARPVARRNRPHRRPARGEPAPGRARLRKGDTPDLCNSFETSPRKLESIDTQDKLRDSAPEFVGQVSIQWLRHPWTCGSPFLRSVPATDLIGPTNLGARREGL